MTRRRFAPFLIAAFLFTSVVVTRIALAHFRLDRGSVATSGELFAGSRRLPNPEKTAAALLPSPGLSANEGALSATPVFTLSSESSAQLAEEIELNGLAEQADLTLTANQLKAFADVTALHQAIRESYEWEIASAVRAQDGRSLIEIPAYSDAGNALRAAFYADLREVLGASTAAQIEAKVGSRLEGRFGGFGAAEQMIELPAASSDSETEPVLQRTILYSNPSAGADHPVVRQEAYFPRFEDTAGRSVAIMRSLFGTSLSLGRL